MIATKIGDFIAKMILVDRDASHDVPFTNVLSKKALSWKKRVFPTNEIAYLSQGQHVIIGDITLPHTLGKYPLKITQVISFLAVDSSAPYNRILGRPSYDMILNMEQLSINFLTN